MSSPEKQPRCVENVSLLVMSGTGAEEGSIEEHAKDQCQKEILRDLEECQRQQHVLIFSPPVTLHVLSPKIRVVRSCEALNRGDIADSHSVSQVTFVT